MKGPRFYLTKTHLRISTTDSVALSARCDYYRTSKPPWLYLYLQWATNTHWTRLMAAFLLATFALAMASSIEAKGLEEKFKIARPKSHHVVLVDTSGSMKDLFEDVRKALHTLLEGLPREDFITVYRFDDYPVRLCHDAFQKLNVDDCIPKTLNSDPASKTEIGETFEKALTEIENSDASVFTLFFITDGKEEPRKGSKFQIDRAGSWTRLAQRGLAMSNRKEIWAYGLGLRQYTDVNLLTKIVPREQVEVITINNPSDLRGRMEQLKDNVRKKWLRSAVMKELKSGFLELAAVEPSFMKGQQVSATYAIKSSYPHLDIEPVSMTVIAPVEELKPGWNKPLSVPTQGQSQPVSISFRVPVESRWHLGRKVVSHEEKMAFKADPQFVDAEEIRKLGLEPKLNIRGFEASVHYSYRTGLPIGFLVFFPLSILGFVLAGVKWLKIPRAEVFGVLSAAGIPQKDLQHEHRERLSVGGTGKDVQLPNATGAFEIGVKRQDSFDTLFLRPLAGQIELGRGILSSEAEEELRDEVVTVKIEKQEIILTGVSPRRMRSRPWTKVLSLFVCLAVLNIVVWRVGP